MVRIGELAPEAEVVTGELTPEQLEHSEGLIGELAPDAISLDYNDVVIEYDDIVRAASADMLADSGLHTTLRGASTVATALNPLVGSIMAAGSYLGAEGLALGKAWLRSDDKDEFFTRYVNDLEEAAENSSFTNSFVAGSNRVMGGFMPQNLEKSTSGAVLGGIMSEIQLALTTGAIGRSMTSTAGLKTGQEIAFAMEQMENAVYVAGSSVLNALNTYSTKVGYGASEREAAVSAISTGGASAITGTFFLGFLNKVLNNFSKKLINPQAGSQIVQTRNFAHNVDAVRLGSEFGGWGYAEDAMRVGFEKMGGNEDAKMYMDGLAGLGMFGAGFLFKRFLRKPNAELFEDMINIKNKTTPEQLVEDGIKAQSKQSAKVVNDNVEFENSLMDLDEYRLKDGTIVKTDGVPVTNGEKNIVIERAMKLINNEAMTVEEAVTEAIRGMHPDIKNNKEAVEEITELLMRYVT